MSKPLTLRTTKLARHVVKAGGKKIGDWSTHVSHALTLRRGSMQLSVGLTNAGSGLWGVIAIETPAKTAHKPQEILDNHAHDLIGMFSFAQAVIAAEQYAAAWRPGQKPACPCEVIASSPLSSVTGENRVQTQVPPSRESSLPKRSKVKTRNPPRHA